MNKEEQRKTTHYVERAWAVHAPTL